MPLFVAEIVERVTRPPVTSGGDFYRPDTRDLTQRDVPPPDYVIACMQDCWEELPEARPDFKTIRNRLKKLRRGM